MTLVHAYLYAGLLLWIVVSLLWLVSLRLKNAAIIDPCWSLFFLACHGLAFGLANHHPPRALLMSALVAIWSLRLALYLFQRGWGKPEDFRYRAWREANGTVWWWRSYLTVFLVQGLLAWVICMPLMAIYWAPPSGLGVLDLAALLIWLLGFAFEAGGDLQLARFRARPENQGRVLDYGFWRYTRHPNYFGEAAMWWGFFLLNLAAGQAWVIYAPALMTLLLLRVSGVTLLEKTLVTTKPGYQAYLQRTSSFLPWFPKKAI